MFYVKENINDTVEVKVELNDENVFCTCPDCGKEVSVVFADGMGDMYGTAVCCSACSKKRMEALK